MPERGVLIFNNNSCIFMYYYYCNTSQVVRYMDLIKCNINLEL